MADRIGFRAAANVAARLAKSIDDQYDDPTSEYAPSECAAAIGEVTRRQVATLQRRTGWSVAELLNEAEERTSAGWACRSGLDTLVIQ